MKRSLNVLIVNQHGENRGDEAAKRAMLEGISKRIGKTNFTIICQFKDRNLSIKFNQDVILLPMLIPAVEFIGAFTFLLFKFFGINIRFLLGKNSIHIINAYEKADIVISAPGGPYFGDIYTGFLHLHEIAHWFMIIIAILYEKPVFLYAPSAGPFKYKKMNFLRRKLYNQFIQITTREEISKKHLEALLPQKDIILTADSALQRQIKSCTKKEFLKNRYESLKNKHFIAISLNDYKYPLSKNPLNNQKSYKNFIIELLTHTSNIKDCHFIMFPQLYGNIHSDVFYLKNIGNALSKNISWEIINPEYNSDQQQSLFGMCELSIVSRYHPQIFSALHNVPIIAICYEHKQFGFMKSLDLEEYAFDIYNLETDKILKAIKNAFVRRNLLSETIRCNMEPLIKKSSMTSELLCNYIMDNLRE